MREPWKRLTLGALPGLLVLLLWLVLEANQATSGCSPLSSVGYRTPIAAALDDTWRYLPAPIPDHITLNVLPSIQLDSQALSLDATRWHAKLVLFRDTAWFAHDMIPVDSLRSWRRVFDVRTLTPSEWKAYWNVVTSDFTVSDEDSQRLSHLHGPVYRVAGEFSRNWPGHDDYYVEVRRTRHGYVACQLLAFGTE